MTGKWKKPICLIVALILICSSISSTILFSTATDHDKQFLLAASDYVALNQNAATREGLLNAVREVEPSANLAEADFYIKHATVGVHDEMTGGEVNEFPLNIKGSCGAVTAVFEWNGNRIPFSATFRNKEETISVSEVAIVGQSAGFTYDEKGNVTGYSGSADKMVFPEGYTGTMTELADKSAVQNIKILIYNNGVAFLTKAFQDWDGLVAVQIENGNNTFNLGSSVNKKREESVFSDCDSLKAFQFPKTISNTYYRTAMFPNHFLKNCPKLENVVMPTSAVSGSYTSYGQNVFYGTAVSELIMPAYKKAVEDKDDCFGGNVSVSGYVQTTNYADAMHFMRAAACAAANVAAFPAESDESTLKNAAKDGIVGSQDAQTFAAGLTYDYEEKQTDVSVLKTIGVSNGTVRIPIQVTASNTLMSLSVTGVHISPVFQPEILEYSAVVPYKTEWVAIQAVPVSGASVGEITGQMNLKVGDNTVLIPVTTAMQKKITYSILITREEQNPMEDVFAALSDYVRTQRNEVTAEGLLATAKEYLPEIQLDAEKDFYLQHSLKGAKDDTTKYPLLIEGKDGAVAAVFTYQAKRYGFSCGFAHETETIKIKEIAVVGESAGFTYDAKGNVTGYSGTADKIVFPAGYSGTMTNLSDKSAVKKVKVLVINNGIAFFSKAFNNWDSLIAVSVDNGNSAMNLASALNSKREDHIFSECDNLKYFQFPKVIANSFYWNAMFPNSFLENCPRLETVVMPKNAASGDYTLYGYHVFYGTAVHQLAMPAYGKTVKDDGECFGGSATTLPGRNLHLYEESMSLPRAAAQAAAAIVSADTASDSQVLKDIAKNAITDSFDAQTFAESCTFSFREENQSVGTKKTILLSDGTDTIPLSVFNSKGLLNIQIKGYDLSFDPLKTEYALSVSYKTSSLSIRTKTVNGAKVDAVTGQEDLSFGANKITVTVRTTEGISVQYVITVTREDPPDEEYLMILDAAKKYVLQKKNTVTPQGLLSVVKEQVPDVELNIEDDFYIKHAVNGVKDDTSDYPLCIEGSDGAVAAVFTYHGKRYGFSCAFSHETEIISVSKTAVVGQSDGFTYDAKGNVTGYTGDADKIVFPVGYPGTMLPVGDTETVAGIKVLMIQNGVAFIGRAFHDWDGLIAVQIDNGDTAFNLGSAVNSKREEHIFSGCDELKYFQFPKKICNTLYWNAMFPNNFLSNCPKLETVIMPSNATSGAYTMYGYHIFYGTAVRDITWPSYSKTPSSEGENFANSTVLTGTRNLHEYSENMTFVRASAYAAAAVNGFGAEQTQDEVLSGARQAITGSKNAASFADSLRFAVEDPFMSNEYAVTGSFVISDGKDTIPIDFSAGKGLKSLDIGFPMTPFFSPEITDYTVAVSSRVQNLIVSAVPANGATVGAITGDKNLKTGVEQTLTVPVTTSEGKNIVYTVHVTRQEKTELNESLIRNIRAYAAKFYGDNYSSKEAYHAYLASYEQYLDITIQPIDFYKYNSVPGAVEGTTVLVPGHKGYLSAEAVISNGQESEKIVILSPITPYMKEYSFTADEVSKKKDFHLSEDGKTLEWYSGDAKKVIIPDGVVNIEMGWYSGEKPEEVEVVIVPDSVEELPSNFCYNFVHLEAVYLGNNITTIPGSAFSRCYYLQFIHLPEELAEIGGSAFKYAMSLPEMAFPSTLESIGSQAFWTCGIRNYSLPKNLLSIAAYGICYPQFTGGVWQEDAQSPEMKADLTALMKSYHFDTTPVTVTVLGENLILTGGNSFGGTDYQATGAQLHVRAPESLENTVFADKLHPWAHYDFSVDMSMAETAARMQVALDHVLLLKTATEHQAETAAQDAVFYKENRTLEWTMPYTVQGNRVTGELTLANGVCSAILALDCNIFTPPPVSSGSVLRGDKTDIRMKLILDDDFLGFDDFDESDFVWFDSFDDQKPATINQDSENETTGDILVQIHIKKLSPSVLTKSLQDRLKKYPYVVFDLSLESEETVHLNGKIGVAVPRPKEFKGSQCHVYYVTNDGKLIDMKAKSKGKYMLFYTTSLGKYILVQDVVDYTPTIILCSCIGGTVLLAAGMILFVILRKKKKQKKGLQA